MRFDNQFYRAFFKKGGLKLKKRLILVLTCLIIFLLSGCNEKETEEVMKENQSTKLADSTKVNETQEVEMETENKEVETSSIPSSNGQEVETNSIPSSNGQEVEQKVEKRVDQEVVQGINLLEYRPKVGSKKTFTENGEAVFTEEIIAANDEYVQALLQLGDNVTTQIYRWTKDEISLIYEEFNLDNPRQDLLNSFEPTGRYEILVNNDTNQQTDWKLVSKEGQEAVPAGNFTKVITIEKTTDEVVNEETKYTRYYAPEQGLIKEIYDVTGENGYSFISELEIVE